MYFRLLEAARTEILQRLDVLRQSGEGVLGLLASSLDQWFFTLLEVLNLARFISAFAEPFLIGKTKYDFFKT